MDVLLVSGRSRTATPHPSRAQAATLAQDLAAAGHTVRWICPVQNGGGPAVQLPPGAEFLPAVSHAPPFRAVKKSLVDVATDQLVSRQVRARLPDVVHVLAYGGVSAPHAVWIADRLGAPVVVDVTAADVLCHRSTLINERDETCTEWQDPARCLACCMTPFEGGLTPAEVAKSQWSRRLGPWSSFPGEMDFRNRLDALLAPLLSAAAVLVEDQAEHDLMATAGVSKRNLRIMPRPHTASGALAIYESVRVSAATE